MARTFITSGEGSQQTLSDIQNEKIPVYDSEQDAESDLANLAEGQIVGTKEGKFDIDDMKQYIRNQNVLDPEWLSVRSDTDPTYFTNWEVPYDGFIIFQPFQSTSGTIKVNNFALAGYVNNSCDWTVLVSKGDIVNFTGNASRLIRGRFYKLRDYSDR